VGWGAVATFGLVLTILGTFRHRPAAVPASVALDITAAYWFTCYTSFANPAIGLARGLSNTFRWHRLDRPSGLRHRTVCGRSSGNFARPLPLSCSPSPSSGEAGGPRGIKQEQLLSYSAASES
jgi:hypothetical protein